MQRYELHDNVTILETETSTSEYSRRTSDQDDVSTTYLAANLYGQSPAATHDDGHVHYYDGDYEYDYDEEHYTPKEDPLATSAIHLVALSPTIVHGHAQDQLALWINYTAIGITHGLFQALLYPYLKIYLNMEEYRAASGELIVALPWCFKLALALLTDCVPIRSQRRKPYLYGGWILCAIFSLIVACIPSETPYLEHGKIANDKAADAGGKYIGLFFMASLGLVLTSVVCDAIVIELSHREIESRRGTVLLTVFMARYAGHAGMTFLAAFLCNSKPYGGEFAWGASPNLMSLFAVAAALVAVAATKVYLVEDVRRQRPTQSSNPYHPSRASTIRDDPRDAATPQPAERRSSQHTGSISVVRARPHTLWVFMQRRSTLQFLVYVFCARVCFSYYTASTKVLYETWVSISPLMSSMFTVVNSLVFVSVAFLLRRSHLLASWKRLIQGAVLISVVITAIPAIFVVTNVVRNNILTLLVEQLVAFVEAMAYYAIVLAILEATDASGLEASSFALFTSIANAAIPFATSLAQSIGSHFDAYDSQWAKDTSSVRWKMVYALLVWILFRVANITLLPLLPKQKREMHLLKEFGGTHRIAALYVSAAAAFVLLWAPFTTILSAFETTACLTVAGGEGC